MSIEKCNICGTETKYFCRDCESPVCDNCTIPYNQFTQVDYTLCKNCGDEQNEGRAIEHQKNQEYQEEKAKERRVKNDKKRVIYNSPAQIEKRRIKKIEKIQNEIEQRIERTKAVAEIFKNIFR